MSTDTHIGLQHVQTRRLLYSDFLANIPDYPNTCLYYFDFWLMSATALDTTTSILLQKPQLPCYQRSILPIAYWNSPRRCPEIFILDKLTSWSGLTLWLVYFSFIVLIKHNTKNVNCYRRVLSGSSGTSRSSIRRSR